jgi:hypothetical protein
MTPSLSFNEADASSKIHQGFLSLRFAARFSKLTDAVSDRRHQPPDANVEKLDVMLGASPHSRRPQETTHLVTIFSDPPIIFFVIPSGERNFVRAGLLFNHFRQLSKSR